MIYAVYATMIARDSDISCRCPHCAGYHDKPVDLLDLFDADTNQDAVGLFYGKYGDRDECQGWITYPHAVQATLRDIERYALAQWTSGNLATAMPNVLARARGEIPTDEIGERG